MRTPLDVLAALTGTRDLSDLASWAASAPYRSFAAAVARDRAAAECFSAVDFLANHARQDAGVVSALPPHCPGVSALDSAVEIAMGAELPRAELEARVLADQSTQVIAHFLGVSEESVSVYERFFFDVRSRRPDPTWIRQWVLRMGSDPVLRRHDVALLWKIVGYRYGAATLDSLICSVAPGKLTRQGVDSYVKYQVPLPLEVKLWIAGERMPIPRTPQGLQLLQNYSRLKDAVYGPQGADLAPALSRLLNSKRTLPVEDCLLRLAMLAVREIK